MMGDCTVVIVAHRLNTLQCADTVYRLEGEELCRYDSFEQESSDPLPGSLPSLSDGSLSMH